VSAVPSLGRIGIWGPELRFGDRAEAAEAAAELEELGFGALWIPDVGGDVLGSAEVLLRAAPRATIATGILNIWMHEPADVAQHLAGWDAGWRDRFVLGLGVSHERQIASRGHRYEKPVTRMSAYLDALDDDAFAERVAGVSVYARTTPEQKLRIVDAWKRRGAVVAMTGDGVNDAPALRRADIGVAMGVTGTDVSKEAADMVLADDNFATIVDAVAEGRRIYDNIRRFVRYLLTTNSGEIWVMFLAPLIGLPVPLLPVQILWVNLVTDGLPAIALGLEPGEADTMRRPPRHPQESIFADGLWQHAVWVGLLMAAVVLPVQAVARAAGWHWPTMVFSTLALLQLGHALAVRSERRSFFSLGARSNPWLLGAVVATMAVQLAIVYLPFLQEIFGTAALGPVEFAVVSVASCTVFIAVELEKWCRRRAAVSASTDGGPQ